MSHYDPTVSQRLIWLDQASDKDSAKYNIGGYAHLEANLSYPDFNAAVLTVLQSQEVYSTIFSESNGELSCHISAIPAEYRVGQIDFSGEVSPESSAIGWMERDFSEPFTLTGEYLFHFKLLKIREKKYFWYARIHHLIGDGYSFKLLLNQTADIYSMLVAGRPIVCKEYTYSEYASEDGLYYQSGEAAADKQFWLNEYSSLPAPLFPVIHHGILRPEAGAVTLSIDAGLKQQLQAVADLYKVSLFHLIVGVVHLYFSRITGQSRIAIGVPVLNRTKKIYRQTAGVFMNLLSIPFESPPDKQLGSLLAGIRQKMSSVLRHQRYQYGNLVMDLDIDASRRLLYDIRISYEDFDFTSDFGGMQAEAIALSNCAEVDPLAIYVREYHGHGFDIRLIYNTACFSRERVLSISRSLYALLQGIVADASVPLDRIDMADPSERARILAYCVGERQDRPERSFVSMWNKSVLLHPGRVAVSGKSRLTYKEVDLLARKVASVLRAAATGTSSLSVALLLTRSESMVAAMIGSLLAGCCYTPIDPEYPEERIRYILEDAHCPVLLTDTAFSPERIQLPGMRIIDMKEMPEGGMEPFDDFAPEDPRAACYMIYTSGTTGGPKGVLISFESLVDYTCTVVDHFKMSKEDVVLQQSSICFDTSVEEIFPVLAAGGRLHILEDRKNLDALQRVLEEEHISVLSTGPWVIRYLQQVRLPLSLRLVISGGDVLKREYINRIIAQGIDVYNTYGPTETTVCATYYKAGADDAVIPIGRPISNKRVYILDNCQRLQPLGVEGEICIAGKGVALGYFGRSALTEEKFVEDICVPGERMYRTGDLGMLEADGNILFRGRKDDQLNYRGYRIETKEIEMVIQAHAAIADCLVEVRERHGMPVLTAYLEYGDGDPLPATAWRKLLAKKLPAYMIPEAWVRVREFPLLPNGKIDKGALAENGIEEEEAISAGQSVPETPEEQQLHDIWVKIIRKDAIGIDDVFFESGGHSLNMVQLLIAIKERYRVDIKMHDLFENDTIRKQALFLSTADKSTELPVREAAAEHDYPLTDSQQYIWIVSQHAEASLAYHISGALCIRGALDISALQQTVDNIVGRHESLRTIFFETSEGVVRQAVLEQESLGTPVFSFFRIHERAVGQVLADIADRPFDLAKGPLVRAILLETGPSEYIFVYVMHHIISDGWSMEVLSRELMTGYNALVTGNSVDWRPLSRQFRHFLPTEGDADQNREEAAKTYWIDKFQGAIPLVELPAQHARPAIKTYKGGQVIKNLGRDSYTRLCGFCEKEGVTLFTGLFAILNILIHRYTGETESIVGTPVANRDRGGQEDQIGLFLNVLPVRTSFSGQQTFRELLLAQKKELSAAYRYQRYPLHELLHALHYRNDASRSPLFDLLIVLHNQQVMHLSGPEAAGYSMEGVEVEVFESFPRRYSQFDMTFAFFYEKGHLQLRLEYNTDLFEEWYISQLADHYLRLCKASVDDADGPIGGLSYFSVEGLPGSGGSNAAAIAPSCSGWMGYLTYWSSRDPGRTAVVSEGERMSYTGLLETARNIAGYLVHESGLVCGERVGVLLEPGLLFPACLLGIWLAGGVYVPVNTGFPPARQQMILDDAACRILIDAAALASMSQYISEKADTFLHSDGLAYILYTSGTTGKPKGVAVSQEALLLKLQAEMTYMPKEAPVSSCLLTNYCFDVFFLELLLPLLTGGRIVVPSRVIVLQPDRLAALMIEEGVNVLHGTPTFMDSFFRSIPEYYLADLDKTVALICLGGESLYQKLVDFLRNHLPSVRINNHYGPTEAVIHAVVLADIQSFGRNVIGRPMPGVKVFVADGQFQLQPPGVRGELLIGGDRTLAEGYVNRQEETEGKFVDNPWEPSEKLYRTGDMVRWTHEGQLEYLGRSDDQVKIRGLRIEPDEIRRVLESYPAIDQAVVIPYGSGVHTSLAAFFVAPVFVDERRLKSYLQEYLPEYMVPALYKPVAVLLLNENGKVDKEALLGQIDLRSPLSGIVEARTDLERKLVRMWEDLLERSPIGIRCNFYDLGGNSILMIRMRAQLERQMGIRLGIRELLSVPTIEDMSETIETMQWMQRKSDEGRVVQEFTL